MGYLEGSQHYAYGCPNSGCDSKHPADPTKGKHDMWHNAGPGVDIVPELVYSANTYTDRAVKIIEKHNASEPLSLLMMYQNVHSPYSKPPGAPQRDASSATSAAHCGAASAGWEDHNYPKMWDETYANMLAMLDQGPNTLTECHRNPNPH